MPENQFRSVALLSFALFLCAQRVVAQQTPAVASSPNGSPSSTPPVFSPTDLSGTETIAEGSCWKAIMLTARSRTSANNIGPRLSGSTQAAKAVDYVAAELKALGCTCRLRR